MIIPLRLFPPKPPFETAKIEQVPRVKFGKVTSGLFKLSFPMSVSLKGLAVSSRTQTQTTTAPASSFLPAVCWEIISPPVHCILENVAFKW